MQRKHCNKFLYIFNPNSFLSLSLSLICHNVLSNTPGGWADVDILTNQTQSDRFSVTDRQRRAHLVRVLLRRLLDRTLIGSDVSDESSPLAATSSNCTSVGSSAVMDDGVLLDCTRSADSTVSRPHTHTYTHWLYVAHLSVSAAMINVAQS